MLYTKVWNKLNLLKKIILRDEFDRNYVKKVWVRKNRERMRGAGGNHELSPRGYLKPC